MSDPNPKPDHQGGGEWAPHDYTDGKQTGEWQTSYPPEARSGIVKETWYLVLITLGYSLAALWIVHESTNLPVAAKAAAEQTNVPEANLGFLGFLAAWIGGATGGCCFGLKWMYHSVAKQIWHEDRRLWRILTPHISGILSFFMVLLVASGLLQLFDSDFAKRPIAVLAFSFLVGYFSDKALAKMAEVADTLFGGQKKPK